MTTKTIKISLLAIAMFAIMVPTSIQFVDAESMSEATKKAKLQKFMEIGQNYERINNQLETTSVAADRASLENELESLIKKANALGVPTREQQKEDPNAWPMEIFIPEQMQKIEANIQTASMSDIETYGIVPMSTAEILEVCCNSVEGLTGFHYTCWGVFTCDGYLSPTSWVTLYTAFDDYFSGENNAALSDVVPFMKIKNTGSANKTIKGDYSIYENVPE